MLSIVATVCSAHDAAPLGNKYVFSVDASAVDVAGEPLYVKDATIEATIEGLEGAGKRLGTCTYGMTNPPTLWVDFPPVVTSAHHALTRVVNCNFNNRDALSNKKGSLTCSAPSGAPVYFDNYANDYFFLAPARVSTRRSVCGVRCGKARCGSPARFRTTTESIRASSK